MPLPKRYAVMTDCGGYGVGAGFGIRTSNRNTMIAEFQSLRQLGCNGFRNAPAFVLDMLRKGEGIGPEFSRVRDTGGQGYPVPAWDRERAPSPGSSWHATLS